MASSSRFGRSNLTAILLLFLSLLSIAVASPLPTDNVNDSLVERTTQKSITQAEYEAYLRKYFPATDHYILYSGKSSDQVKAFKAKNTDYYDYDDLFNAYDDSHPWYKAFNEETQIDDGEASSRAMAAVATDVVLVFGAIEYETAGASSFYTLEEAPLLKASVKAGKLKSINHMAKGATSASEVMAKEDANGKFTWQEGYKAGDKNASGSYAKCKRTLSTCDTPKPNAKTKTSTKKTTKTT